MIRVSVMYQNEQGKKFDWDYYLNKHCVTVRQKLTPLGLVRAEIDKGLGSAQPGVPAPFLVMAHMYFNNVGDFQKCMAIHGGDLMSDIPNFTNIQPQVQISEIL